MDDDIDEINAISHSFWESKKKAQLEDSIAKA